MRSPTVVLAAALVLAAPARAADLVVWWEKGFYPQEDEAVHEIIAAFAKETGKQVELTLYSQDELPDQLEAAIEAGRPPDFTFGILLQDYLGQWAGEDRLADLSDAMGAFSNLFDPDALAGVTWRNAQTGQKALYGLPFGREMNHVHVWTSLLKQAGFTRRRHSARMGGVLVVLVRPGAARRAQGAGPGRHLGRRPADVGAG